MPGYFEEDLEFKGRRIKGKIYVAKKGLNILGLVHQGFFEKILKTRSRGQVFVGNTNDES